MDKCPKCNNTQGFVFGTCIECGWNYNENEYTHITVWAHEARLVMGRDAWKWLVDQHDAHTTAWMDKE